MGQLVKRSWVRWVIVMAVFSLAGEPEARASNVYISPLPGLTTTWHPAPERTSVPQGTTLRFKRRMEPGASVTWSGADQVLTDGEWSIAVCHLDQPGSHVVASEYQRPDGTISRERCLLDVEPVRPEDVRVSPIRVSVEPVTLDETNLNASTYRYFGMSSIADLRDLGDGRYRTSVGRWVNLEVEVDPPGFAPLIEWRWHGEGFRRRAQLGSSTRVIFWEPGTYPIWAGPPDHPARLRLDTYSVEITSHRDFHDIVPEGFPVTFRARTVPGGLEDEITWLASTKYGRAEPVLGRGPSFTVRFEDTFGFAPFQGPLQWLGVRADNAAFNQDQKRPQDRFCSQGQITIEIDPGILPPHPDGLVETLSLTSQGLENTVVVRTPPPYTDCAEGEPDPDCPDIETEMTTLELAATSPTLGPILIRERQDMASTGAICRVNADAAGRFLSGDSYFDVWAEVELAGGMLLHTADPVRLQAAGITELPPFGRGYIPQPPSGGVCGQPGGPQTIPLVTTSGVPVGRITHALHVPGCPEEGEQEEKLKIVPLRLCIVDTADASPQTGRLDINTLKRVVAQKNVIWKQCGVEFRLNRNAVDFVADPLDPPVGAGMTSDIQDPGSGIVGLFEYLAAVLSCNVEAGEDAFEKLTEIFIRAFVDAAGVRTGTLGATVTPQVCRQPFVGWKPVVIDPNWFNAPLPDLGRVLAHENGHALSLHHTANVGDLMFPTFEEGGLVLSPVECAQARAEAQKISGTVDKDEAGVPMPRHAPRTRMAPDQLEDPPRPGADLFEYVVTVEEAESRLHLSTLLAGVPEPSATPFFYRFALDLDADPATGGDPGVVFGFPGTFTGAEVYAELEVVFEPAARVVRQRSFVFQGGSFEPLEDVVTDVAVFTVETAEDSIPALVLANAELAFGILPQPLEEGFRSAGSAQSQGLFDESPVVVGTLEPFAEPTLILLSPVRGPAGTVVNVQGEAFSPSTEVEIFLDTALAATATTDDSGQFVAEVVVPDVPPGPLSVFVVDAELASDAMIFTVESGAP